MKDGERTRESPFVTGVLLAAGESKRLADYPPKPLLEFRGEPLIRRVVREALCSRLKQLIVVLGYMSNAVGDILSDLDVTVVDNPDYARGQSTSVRVGLKHLDPSTAAALFMPVDQPFLDSTLLDQLIDAYANTDTPVVLPAYKSRRGAPVLFDRSLFSELSRISGDTGGQQVLKRHPSEVLVVPLENEAPLLDIDTPDDYQNLMNLDLD